MADPGFLRGTNSQGYEVRTWGYQNIIWLISPRNCMKIKEIGPMGEGASRVSIPTFGSANCCSLGWGRPGVSTIPELFGRYILFLVHRPGRAEISMQQSLNGPVLIYLNTAVIEWSRINNSSVSFRFGDVWLGKYYVLL